MACVAEIYFPLVRRTALNAIWQSYRASSTRKMTDWTLNELIEVLGFETEEEVQDFCISYGFTVPQRDDGVSYLDLNSVSGRSLPEPAPGSQAQRKSDVVERKRYGRALSAIISGFSVAEAEKAGLVEQSALHEERSRQLANGRAKSLFITDESDDESSRPVSADSSSFGQLSASNKIVSPFGTSSASQMLPPQDTKSSFTFGSITPQPNGESTPIPGSNQMQPQTHTRATLDARPANQDSPSKRPENATFTFGGFPTPGTGKSSLFTQPPGLTEKVKNPSQSTDQQFTPSTFSSGQNAASAFPINPSPMFNSIAASAPIAGNTGSQSIFSPVATSREPYVAAEPKAPMFASSPNNAPSFTWNSPNKSFGASPTSSAPQFTFPSQPSTTAAPAPALPAQPSFPQPALPSFSFGQSATSKTQDAPSAKTSRPQAPSSPSSTIQQPLFTAPSFPSSKPIQQPVPESPGPSLEERDRIARVKAAAEKRKAAVLHQIAKSLVVEKYGLLEQFVEYTTLSLIQRARQQVVDERAAERAGQYTAVRKRSANALTTPR